MTLIISSVGYYVVSFIANFKNIVVNTGWHLTERCDSETSNTVEMKSCWLISVRIISVVLLNTNTWLTKLQVMTFDRVGLIASG